eukprot:UN29883
MGDGLDNAGAYVADIVTTKWAIAASIAIAIIVSFGFITFLRVGGGCLIWGALISVAIGGGLLGAVMISKSSDVKDYGYDTGADVMFWTGVVVIILDIVFILLMIFLRDRINLAVELVGEAGRALTAIPTMLAFPINELVLP